MSINRVILSGNLTREPELRATAGGTSVLGFGIAVNDRRRNQQTGEWEEHPNFVDCTVFGKRAESLSNILVKGAKVALEGKLRWSQWEKNGEKRSKLEVVADEIELMSGKGQQSESSAAHAPAYAQEAAPVAAPAAPYAGGSIYDQDISF